MKELSDVAKKVTFSPIRQMFNLAQGMSDVISFTVGEPDFLTPPNVVEAAVKALREGAHKYTPNAGIYDLRKALCDRRREQFGADYDPDCECIVTAGGMEALMLTMMAILNPGDEFILTDPTWTNYSRQILICSAVPKFVDVDETTNFTFDPDELEKAITDKTKGFIINSPSNPTGGIASREILEKLADIAIRHDLWVISDEVYTNIHFTEDKPFSIASIPGMKGRTIVIGSFSKTYAMTGWRVGYAFGPREIVSNMVKLQENVAACVNTAAQFGALEAVSGSQEAVINMVAAYRNRCELAVRELSTVPKLSCFAPQGAFYLFVNIEKTGMDAESFAKDLLKKEHVIVVPGYAFGTNGNKYVRLSVATSEEKIIEGIARIRHYMSNL